MWLTFASTCVAREVIDATGKKLSIPDSPKRIVTLVPSLGELVADFLGQNLEKIVGVSERTQTPPALARVLSVGPYHQINVEKVISVHPDLVFATLDGNQKDRVTQLRELGINVVCVNTESFQEIGNSMILVATSLGMSSEGTQVAERFKRGLENIGHQVDLLIKNSPNRKKVLIQVGDSPLVVVGGGTYLSEILDLLKVSNVYSKSSVHYLRPSIEDVAQKNPETIFVLGGSDDARLIQPMAAKWKQYSNVVAVKQNQVFLLTDDSLLRPTIRLLEGISRLKKRIYGDA